MNPLYPLAKRLLDLTVASTALVLSSPAFILLPVAVRVTAGRPVLFRQTRPGLKAQPFAVLKRGTGMERHGNVPFAGNQAPARDDRT